MATEDGEGTGGAGAEPEPRPKRHPARRLAAAFVSGSSYGLVLLLIIVSYLMSVSFHREWGASVVILVQVVTVWFALRTSQARRPVRLVADIVLAGALFVALFDRFVNNSSEPVPAIFVMASVLYVMAPFAILRHLISRNTIDLETMLGAIAAYMLIGLAFAYVYRFFGAVQSVPFFGLQGEGAIGQDVFFSFTTLTTTGYGNLVPAGQPGQTLAVMEMIVGQLFLITAVGKIVTVWRPGSMGRERA
jgi:hypothetical protein